MTQSVNLSYIGVGKIHGRVAGSAAAMRFLGNASAAMLKQDVEEIREPDYTRLGGGTLQIVRRLKAVKLDLTLMSWIAANYALAVAGTATAVPSATITDEIVKGYKGGLVRLATPPGAITTVKNSAGSTTYAAGTDYTMSPAGLMIPLASAIVDAADLKVTYTNLPHDRIEAATTTSTTMEICVEGLNEVDSGAPCITDMWRVSMPPASELALLGDKLGELKFSAELLADTTKGVGASAFFRSQKT